MFTHRHKETPWSWLRSILDNAADGIVAESGERVIYANDAYAAMLGYRRSDALLEMRMSSLIAASDADRLLRYGRMRISGERAPATYDFAALRRDGSTIRLQASVSTAMVMGNACITTIVRPFPVAHESGDGSSSPITGPHETLSTREHQVMEMLLGGKRLKLIAFELRVSEKTVATHRSRLLQKLGASDTVELFQYAIRHRLVDWS